MPYIMTLVSLFAADSIFKCYIEKHENIDDVFKTKCKADSKLVMKRYHNRGAMCNLGEKNQHGIALLSLVFSAFMTGIFVATLGTRGKRLLKTGLALILGGAYSNTYDRLRRKYVVDYFSFHLFDKKKLNQEKHSGRVLGKLDDRFSAIVFNLADFGILVGALLLVISELWTN